MVTIRQTETFSHWFHSLRDRGAKARILVRIDRLRLGYFVQKGDLLIVLLPGGDKRTQRRDIQRAMSLAGHLAETENGDD